MGDPNIFTAERIVDKKFIDGVMMYHIKWRGYSSKQNTWEPVENIIDKSLLTNFEKQQAKKGKRRSTSSANKSRASIAKDSDDRENSINNPPDSTSKASAAATPVPSPPRYEQVNGSNISPVTPRSPSNNHARSINTSSIPPVVAKTPPTSMGLSPSKVSSTPPPTTSNVSRLTSSPINSRNVSYSPSSVKLATPSPTISTTRITEVQVDSLKRHMESIEETTVKRINSNSSPMRMSTPLPVNNIMVTPQQDNNLINSAKNRRVASKVAIMNTVITDVTVNDQTITISESKTNQGFFREVSRNSVAVDTNHSNDCIDMKE